MRIGGRGGTRGGRGRGGSRGRGGGRGGNNTVETESAPAGVDTSTLDPSLAAFGGLAPDGSVELVWDATTKDPSTFAQFMGAVVPSDVLGNYKVNWIRINVKHPQRPAGEFDAGPP
eukprot:COSAG02_NODE_830_length_16689_cov_10.438999_8_plen_116_part_00